MSAPPSRAAATLGHGVWMLVAVVVSLVTDDADDDDGRGHDEGGDDDPRRDLAGAHRRERMSPGRDVGAQETEGWPVTASAPMDSASPALASAYLQ